MLRRLGAVQLDTISVLARSHELVAYARLGAVGRARVERAYWGPKSETSSIGPMRPASFHSRTGRRTPSSAGRGGPKGSAGMCCSSDDKTCAEVMARLRAEGPLTANELGGPSRGASGGTGLTSRSPRSGCSTWEISWCVRDGASSVSTTWLSAPCRPSCSGRTGRTRSVRCSSSPRQVARLGVATVSDLAVYHGLPNRLAQSVLGSVPLTEVAVEGWRRPRLRRPAAALAALGTRARGRSVLLSPFDSLNWYRERLERLFGLRHRMEAYTPKAKRTFGYFAMPVLGGTEIVGLVDPGRRGDTLVAKHVTLLRPGAVGHVVSASTEAASWVGSASIDLERSIRRRQKHWMGSSRRPPLCDELCQA